MGGGRCNQETGTRAELARVDVTIEANQTFVDTTAATPMPAAPLPDAALLRAKAAGSTDHLLAKANDAEAADVMRMLRNEFAIKHNAPADTTDASLLRMWKAHTLTTGAFMIFASVVQCVSVSPCVQ